MFDALHRYPADLARRSARLAALHALAAATSGAGALLSATLLGTAAAAAVAAVLMAHAAVKAARAVRAHDAAAALRLDAAVLRAPLGPATLRSLLAAPDHLLGRSATLRALARSLYIPRPAFGPDAPGGAASAGSARAGSASDGTAPPEPALPPGSTRRALERPFRRVANPPFLPEAAGLLAACAGWILLASAGTPALAGAAAFAAFALALEALAGPLSRRARERHEAYLDALASAAEQHAAALRPPAAYAHRLLYLAPELREPP